jgi:hypothetical protein
MGNNYIFVPAETNGLFSKEYYKGNFSSTVLPDARLDEKISAGRLDVLVRGQVELGHRPLLEECGVAQVVRHHDRRIQRRKVQRGNWHVVITCEFKLQSCCIGYRYRIPDPHPNTQILCLRK